MDSLAKQIPTGSIEDRDEPGLTEEQHRVLDIVNELKRLVEAGQERAIAKGAKPWHAASVWFAYLNEGEQRLVRALEKDLCD